MTEKKLQPVYAPGPIRLRTYAWILHASREEILRECWKGIDDLGPADLTILRDWIKKRIEELEKARDRVINIERLEGELEKAQNRIIDEEMSFDILNEDRELPDEQRQKLEMIDGERRFLGVRDNILKQILLSSMYGSEIHHSPDKISDEMKNEIMADFRTSEQVEKHQILARMLSKWEELVDKGMKKGMADEKVVQLFPESGMGSARTFERWRLSREKMRDSRRKND